MFACEWSLEEKGMLMGNMIREWTQREAELIY